MAGVDPVEQGLDPMPVAELYHNAAELDILYSLLVIKNGYMIAKDYFNEGSIDKKDRLQSVTKSYTSALVGIALDQGCLLSVDQMMLISSRRYMARFPTQGKSR